MKFENTDVYNFENAIRGMRLPMNSNNKSDSEWIEYPNYYKIGNNDFDLMQRLIKGGSPHDKFMRQIFVSVDITAPLFFWKEMDQYKVGTTTNSQSTIHKLATTPITIDCFETDDYEQITFGVGEIILSAPIESMSEISPMLPTASNPLPESAIASAVRPSVVPSV